MKQVKDFPDWASIHFCDTPRVILKKDLQQMSPEQVASLGECYVLDTRKEGGNAPTAHLKNHSLRQ